MQLWVGRKLGMSRLKNGDTSTFSIQFGYDNVRRTINGAAEDVQPRSEVPYARRCERSGAMRSIQCRK